MTPKELAKRVKRGENWQIDREALNKMIKYEFKNGKHIFNKDGVYFSLTIEQVNEMWDFCGDILAEECDAVGRVVEIDLDQAIDK